MYELTSFSLSFIS